MLQCVNYQILSISLAILFIYLTLLCLLTSLKEELLMCELTYNNIQFL